MKKVFQTTFGGCNAPLLERGNCLSACLASILELPITEVPNFHVVCDVDSIDWGDAVNQWLGTRGYWFLEMPWSQEHETLVLEPYAGHYIMSGRSPRGNWRHGVVAGAGQICHDPRPGTTAPYLLESTEEYPWTIGVLVQNGAL